MGPGGGGPPPRPNGGPNSGRTAAPSVGGGVGRGTHRARGRAGILAGEGPMTPDEATFIVLWTQGLEIAAIAQRLGIPKRTVQSRAHRLQQRKLIQPRPKGEAYPRQKALARQDGTGVSPRVS